VQALKTRFLYTQTDRESVDEYARYFKSLWDMVEAFGRSLGIHKGLVKGLLALPGRVRDPSNITKDERTKAKEWTQLKQHCLSAELTSKGMGG
jgi:hypothetical protein